MKTILITTSSFGEEDRTPLEKLYEAGYRVVQNPYQRKLTQAEVLSLILHNRPVGMIAGVEPITAEVLSKANCLQVISRCGVGIDNIDFAAAKSKGIKVVNTPDAPCQAVAELTVALVLAQLRNIPLADQNLKKRQWARPKGSLLNGKVIGIIGCGRIGTAVADLLSSFGVDLLGFDAYLTEHSSIKLVSLDDLLERSDIITLHLPYSASTEHLVDDSFLQRMQPGSILVNTSRGGLLDEKALYDSLVSGHLGGACVDTFEEEPYKGELIKLPNTILTPHIGSYTKETRINMEKEAALNLLQALKGEVS